VTFSPDGKLLVLGSDTVEIWEVAVDRRLPRLPILAGKVLSTCFYPDGVQLAIGEDGQIEVWDVTLCKQLRSFFLPGEMISCVTFSQACGLVASGEQLLKLPPWEGTIHLFETINGKLVRSWSAPPEGAMALAFSADGQTLASINGSFFRKAEDAEVRLWDYKTGRERPRIIGRHKGVSSITFSPDGRTLAAGYVDGAVLLWELSSGKERVNFQGHRGSVTALAYSADGRTLVSGSKDTLVMAWDVTGWAQEGKSENLIEQGALHELWKQLSEQDARKAHRCIWRLVKARDSAVAFLSQHLRPVSSTDPDQLASLVKDLDSDRFAVRGRAYRELEKLGELAEAPLRKALEGAPSLEGRRRIEGLLERLGVVPPEQLGAIRAVEVLEQIGSAEARKLLGLLGRGDTKARLTREAKASLQRLEAKN
jgi:WD40 repeat protein